MKSIALRRARKTALALLLSTSAGSAMACGAEPYIGEVCMFAGSYCPVGYVQANGQLMSISMYSTLFAIVGTTFGGDGQTTFGVPDLRGRWAVGWGTNTAVTSNVAWGQKRGQESVTVLPSNLPPMAVTITPTINAVQANGTDSTPAANDLLAIANSGATPPVQMPMYAPAATSGTKVALGGVSAIGALAGGGQPTATISPQLGLTACMASEGLYPPRP
jgi:microcystin-dependent protein